MNRLSAAKAAFQNPEKITVSIPVVNMAPEAPRPLCQDQTEEEKLAAQIIYKHFIDAMEQMPLEEDKRLLDYGIMLLQKQFPDKHTYLHYSMLWLLFHAGYNAGLNDAAKVLDYAAQR